MYIVKCQDQQTCSIAHGMLNNEVPIIVFQTEKLNRTSNQSSPKVTSLPGSTRVRAVHFGQEELDDQSSPVIHNVWFQKISIPQPQRVIGNAEREGVSKAKIFTGKYRPKLEFTEGWRGLQTKKTLLGGSMDIF